MSHGPGVVNEPCLLCGFGTGTGPKYSGTGKTLYMRQGTRMIPYAVICLDCMRELEKMGALKTARKYPTIFMPRWREKKYEERRPSTPTPPILRDVEKW